MYEQYDAIIFDMDGTLVDSGRLHEVAWTESLNHFGIPVNRPLMRSLAGVPSKETVEILLEKFNCRIDAAPADVNAYKESVVRRKLHEYVKPTALIGIVEKYYGSKPMAVGTGAYSDEAVSILKACGILNYFDAVVGADKVGNPKPAPDTFLKCAELLNVPASKCVVFEDSPLGLEAARNAGMVGVDVLKEFNIVNDYYL